jgi:hypothetical protein
VPLAKVIDGYGRCVADLLEKVSLGVFNPCASVEHGEQSQEFVGETPVPIGYCEVVEFRAGALFVAWTGSAVV